MFTFTKFEFEKSLPACGVTFNYLTEFPALMSLRTSAEFYNFKEYISKVEAVSDLKSFEKIYFSIVNHEKYLFASFTRLLLSSFSYNHISKLGHLMDNDFVEYFVDHFNFFDSFLGEYTFYRTFRVLALSICFVHLAVSNPGLFYTKPVPKDATFDEYSVPRFWLRFFPQLNDFYKR